MKVDDSLTEKAVVCDARGERGATESNNLVCTEKQKHIYGNSTHETTKEDKKMCPSHFENLVPKSSSILLKLAPFVQI